jgi:tetratricopeptide (TPR) repeat protein
MALELGDLRRAIDEYRESVRADVGVTDAALAVARLYFALGDYASATEFARRHAQAHPENPVEALRIGIRSLTALERYERARQLTEQLGKIEGQEVATTLERAALEHAAAGPAEAAKVIEESGIDLLDPANEPVLRQLVRLLAEQEQFEEALTRIDAAMSRTPDAAAFYDLRARTLFRANRPAEARRAFETALEKDPAHGPALAGLATLTARQGQREEAVELFRRATRAQPADLESRYHTAQLLIELGRVSEAEQELRDVVRASPWNADACNDLAWVLAEQGLDLDFALLLAERASRIRPQAATLDTLGWVHLQRGEADEAVAALKKAVKQDPSAPAMHYRLALALETQGDFAGALQSYRRAVAAGPFVEAERARVRIAELEREPSS